jgi:hypothetical protein
MTTRPDLESRIAALRVALERILSIRYPLPTADGLEYLARIAQKALAADDAAASAPLPDLPLAEGSEWDDDEVVDIDGNRISIAIEIGTLRVDGASVAFLPDILALARRAGAV